MGSDVRSAESAGCYEEKFRVVEKLQEACAPVEKFSRMKAVLMPDGSYQAVTEEVPVRTVDPQERRKQNLPETLAYTGDKGYKLVDVLDGKVSMENFVAQIFSYMKLFGYTEFSKYFKFQKHFDSPHFHIAGDRKSVV